MDRLFSPWIKTAPGKKRREEKRRGKERKGEDEERREPSSRITFCQRQKKNNIFTETRLLLTVHQVRARTCCIIRDRRREREKERGKDRNGEKV